MTHPGIGLRANLEYLEDAYSRWQRDPQAVEPTLAAFFEGLELGGSSPLALLSAEPTRARADQQPGSGRLARRYYHPKTP
jgi:2-oxoglutarate dehydrogenase complex dehydrogenase (E1) component-like enzyme